MIKLLVIIPTYNRLFTLKKLLNDFDFQIYSKDEIKLDICIVVDGSSDGTIEYLKQFKDKFKVIIGDGNLWFTKCINLGIDYAIEENYDYILTMNDDSRINSDYIEKLTNPLKNLETNSIVGSIALDVNFPNKIVFSGCYSLNKIFWKAKSYYTDGEIITKENLVGIKPTEILTTRGTVFPVKLVKEIGKFDEKLIQYGSDDEFFFRAKKFGYKPYVNFEAIIYDDRNLTNKAAKWLEPTLKNYIKSLFNPISPNYILNSLYLYYKFSYKILVPLYLIYLILYHLKIIAKRILIK